MVPASAPWARALWRACNALMAAFFALAAFVQVRRRGEGLGNPPVCVRLRPSSLGPAAG